MRTEVDPTAIAILSIPLVTFAAGFVAFCWWDILRRRAVRFLPKWAWAMVCLVSVPLGGILYLAFGRDGDDDHERDVD